MRLPKDTIISIDGQQYRLVLMEKRIVNEGLRDEKPRELSGAKSASIISEPKTGYSDIPNVNLTPDHRNFGSWLRDIRRGADITQAELESESGIRQSALSDIERGLRQPRAVNRLKLESAMRALINKKDKGSN